MVILLEKAKSKVLRQYSDPSERSTLPELRNIPPHSKSGIKLAPLALAGSFNLKFA